MITTTSVKHLKLKGPPITIKHFKDGELYVKVPKVKGKVTVIASLHPPAENILELLFVLDALKRQNADIHLIITYFGYTRQDRINLPGEAVSAQVIANMLKGVKITAFDVHGELNKFLRFNNIIPVKQFLPFIPKDVVIVAPDEGAVQHANYWQKCLNSPVVFLKKSRPSHDVVEIHSIDGNVKGRDVLIIDDMISTGSTVIKAAEFLKKSGAKDIYVAATHGVFADNALSKLSKSPIKKIFVTDTLPQKRHRLVRVVSIKKLISQIQRQAGL